MAGKPSNAPRKRRTREHVLADVSYNRLQRHVLDCAWASEPLAVDYGYDAIIYTYAPEGFIEAGNVWVQLKATDRPSYSKDGTTITWPSETKDLDLWLDEPMPVILVVYDAQRDRAYWIDVQASVIRRSPGAKTVATRLPVSQVVSADSVRLWRDRKQRVLDATKRHNIANG
jgi:hypothetical protein